MMFLHILFFSLHRMLTFMRFYTQILIINTLETIETQSVLEKLKIR